MKETLVEKVNSAKRPDTPKDKLVCLVDGDDGWEVKAAVAQNLDTPPDILTKLT